MIAKIRQYRWDLIFISAIFFCTLWFFFDLFFPVAKLFSTPDFGQSDLWQLNYPAKFALAKALSQNSIPLWNDQIATGFPQLAEGQTGVFNLMNLLIYKFLPFKTAINVGYFFIFLSSATGSYLYARLNKDRKSTRLNSSHSQISY